MSVKTVQATINGQTYDLALNNTTGKYEASVTAPSKSSYTLDGHYYNVKITAVDDAGNSTVKDASDAALGAKLRLIVQEKVAPVATVTAPTANALITNSTPVITWTITDNDSGVNPDTISLTIDNNTPVTSGITKTATSNGYNCSYTITSALDDGIHTIRLAAADFDGNAAAASSSTFTIDTVPPTLSVTTPAVGFITNKISCLVSGTTSDVTSGLASLTIKVNSGIAQEAEVIDGNFSKEVTLADGKNTITIQATDVAGKITVVSREVTLDTIPPVFGDIVITPNPVPTGTIFKITVNVTDA
ncbi:Ig-like domain-containing protein [Murimonas intestini]|uniref:Bacterial Ig-like domain-containing protein n=1 Tax=Murimonas intestini TaxID=1337051 RepID=A0AB73T1W6_9FIRM|nr:Ig-like domain-containing protein [Murimonas intestini]MCR1842508.1 Ig-like domain-containing protein [Murimonas intestini]MCR1867134.1 Ig-like domain-containing protein [Murimonas intestini]MCR1884320.1 Ig-like domain-containing protein [Murimonas intestini]